MGYTLAKDNMYTPEELKEILTEEEFDMVVSQAHLHSSSVMKHGRDYPVEELLRSLFCVGLGWGYALRTLKSGSLEEKASVIEKMQEFLPSK